MEETKLSLNTRLAFNDFEEILEDYVYTLAENFDFYSYDEVYATLNYLSEDSFLDLYFCIYEDYDVPDEFYEDIEKSFLASQSLLESYDVDDEILVEGILKKIKKTIKQVKKQIKRNFDDSEVGRYRKRLMNDIKDVNKLEKDRKRRGYAPIPNFRSRETFHNKETLRRGIYGTERQKSMYNKP